MISSRKKFFLIGFATLFPVLAFAAPTYADLVSKVIDYITIAVQLIGALSLLYFAWTIFRIFFEGAQGGNVEEGRKAMLYSVIALASMTSVWALARIIKNTFFP